MNKYIKLLVESLFDDIDDTLDTTSEITDKNIQNVIDMLGNDIPLKNNTKNIDNIENVDAYICYLKVVKAVSIVLQDTGVNFDGFEICFNDNIKLFDNICITKNNYICNNIRLNYIGENNIEIEISAYSCTRFAYNKDNMIVLYLQLFQLLYELEKLHIHVKSLIFTYLNRSKSILSILFPVAFELNIPNIQDYIISNKLPDILLSNNRNNKFKSAELHSSRDEYYYAHTVADYPKEFVEQVKQFVENSGIHVDRVSKLI